MLLWARLRGIQVGTKEEKGDHSAGSCTPRKCARCAGTERQREVVRWNEVLSSTGAGTAADSCLERKQRRRAEKLITDRLSDDKGSAGVCEME